MSLSTPWGPSCSPERCEPGVLSKGAHDGVRILTDAACAVPYGGQLMLYVLVETLLTALWGAAAVGLERLVQAWRVRPRPWHATRTRARTRYDSEKDEVFFQTARGASSQCTPGVPLERFATYTSDPDDDDGPGQRTPLRVALLSTAASIKFGLTLRAAVAALPSAVQLGVGLHLRTRDGVPCPALPRAAGWFGLLGGQATLPTQVVVALLALRPARALAPAAALLAACLQVLWNGTLLVSLGAVARPGPGASGAQCMAAHPVAAIGAGRIAASVLVEVLTASAGTMFAMHIRPRRPPASVPLTTPGLCTLVGVLGALQFARAAVVAAVFPPGASLADALQCAVRDTGQGSVYAFGRFVNLF